MAFTLLAIGGVALAATGSLKSGIFLTLACGAMAVAAVIGTLRMSPRFQVDGATRIAASLQPYGRTSVSPWRSAPHE